MSAENTTTVGEVYRTPRGNYAIYDVQTLSQEGAPPAHVVSESRFNDGAGFENPGMRDAVAHQAAEGLLQEHGDKPQALQLYQQRPDGDFDKVSFRYIGRDGASAADAEEAEARGKAVSFGEDGRPPQLSECGRERLSREALIEKVGVEAGELHAMEETHQQRAASLQTQWSELSGPAIDRTAEIDLLNNEPKPPPHGPRPSAPGPAR